MTQPNQRQPVTWTRLGLAVLVLVALAGALARATPHSDPKYLGIPLSTHLLNYNHVGIIYGGGIRNSELEVPIEPRLDYVSNAVASAAIDAVGELALPKLVQLLGKKDSTIVHWMRQVQFRFNWLQKLPVPRSAYSLQNGALIALRQLGPRARPAVPLIIPLLDDPETALVALLALSGIQPVDSNEILALTNVFGIRASSRSGTTPTMLHTAALLLLGSLETNAVCAIPVLTNEFSGDNSLRKAAAAVALTRIGASADLAVPLILKEIELLISQDEEETAVQLGRFWSIDKLLLLHLWALEQYGPAARPAASLIAKLPTYNSGNLEEAVKKTLRKIEPDPKPETRNPK